MTGESQLQVSPGASDSSPTLSKIRSSLIARGRRDAAILARRSSAEPTGALTCRLAEQGDADAQYSLGVRYFCGHGVRQDYAEAAKWFRKAAEQGHATGQYYIANAYYHGRGVPRNQAESSEMVR